MNRDWRKNAAKNIRKLSPEQARAIIEARDTRPCAQTIHNPAIRELTGGYNSQAINFAVVRMLAIRAGMIKNKS